MAKIYVSIAPRLIKLWLNEEFQNNNKEKFPSDYFVMFGKSKNQDDSGETLYSLGVYKQIDGYPIKGDENLKDILTFLKRHRGKKGKKHIQILNIDTEETL